MSININALGHKQKHWNQLPITCRLNFMQCTFSQKWPLEEYQISNEFLSRMFNRKAATTFTFGKYNGIVGISTDFFNIPDQHFLYIIIYQSWNTRFSLTLNDVSWHGFPGNNYCIEKTKFPIIVTIKESWYFQWHWNILFPNPMFQYLNFDMKLTRKCRR